MPQPTRLIVAAGLAVAGTAIGVGLGRATLDSINPATFKDSDPAFYSDEASDRLPPADWAQVQAQEYQAASQATSPQGCAGCAWPVAPVPPEDPAIARYDQPRTAAVPQEQIEAPVRMVAIQPPPEPDRTSIERYTGYPVDHDGDPAPPADDGSGGDAGTQ